MNRKTIFTTGVSLYDYHLPKDIFYANQVNSSVFEVPLKKFNLSYILPATLLLPGMIDGY